MNVIEVSGLTKQYRNTVREVGLKGAVKHLFKPKYEIKTAVNNICFSVKKGEKIACIGPNGAGKSTAIKMLTGILKPTAGTVAVNGLDPHKNRIKNALNIGAVFGQRTQLWWDIPVIESFHLLKDVYEIPEDIFKKRLAVFDDILNLSRFIGQPVRKLSLGQRMRADIAAALLHNPSIVYLDEPTIGLDVAVKEKVHDFLNYINEEYATTVFLTSHDLSDTERVCRRLIIIDNGIVMYDGSLEKLKADFLTDRKITLITDDPAAPVEDIVRPLHTVKVEKTKDAVFSLTFKHNEISAVQILETLIRNVSIKDFSVEPPHIEDIIKKVYNRTLVYTTESGT